MLITTRQYFGDFWDHPDATEKVKDSAILLIVAVNQLLCQYQDRTSNKVLINPKTNTIVSGTKEGGFRPQSSKQGAKRSSHKTGEGVDIYDPDGKIDKWINDSILEQNELYREHPAYTSTWCHLSTRPPRSKSRTFRPY